MKRITHMVGPLVVAILAASQLGATDCGQVIRDPGFDLWCGDSLCGWKLLRGDIEQVGTWHEADSGVAFLGDNTAIQQVAPVNSNDGLCIKFSMVANVELDAEVFLHIDVEADGTVERSERVAATEWAPVAFLIHLAPPYDGIRFELEKRGNGEAILANIGAELSEDCAGLSQIEPEARPNGASCNELTECGSELCVASQTTIPVASPFGTVCAGCDPALGCIGGDVCGVGGALSPVLAVPMICVAPASAELAEQCLSDGECGSGICLRTTPPSGPGVCSACKTSAECGGEACGPAWLAGSRGPNVCQPGEGAGIAGAPCGSNGDCASGACAGSDRKTCNDGRPCETDTNCPVANDLIPGTCSTVGVQGGTCT
ncbi:MAG: hypothetical protein H0V17_36100 [Deltaproteobacteria bacterium]|nr:hypothetical protein [Deltaproteobacteria bacterium]